MTAAPIRKRPRAEIAWLAVVALLINALLPASLAAVARAQENVSGWCGTHPPGHGTKQDPAAPLCDRCLLCFSPTTVLGPPVPAGASVPAQIAIPVTRSIALKLAAPRPSYRPAQPRGPPQQSG